MISHEFHRSAATTSTETGGIPQLAGQALTRTIIATQIKERLHGH